MFSVDVSLDNVTIDSGLCRGEDKIYTLLEYGCYHGHIFLVLLLRSRQDLIQNWKVVKVYTCCYANQNICMFIGSYGRFNILHVH